MIKNKRVNNPTNSHIDLSMNNYFIIIYINPCRHRDALNFLRDLVDGRGLRVLELGDRN